MYLSDKNSWTCSEEVINGLVFSPDWHWETGIHPKGSPSRPERRYASRKSAPHVRATNPTPNLGYLKMQTELQFSHEETAALEAVISGHGPMPSTPGLLRPAINLFEGCARHLYAVPHRPSGAMRWPDQGSRH